MEKKMDYGKIQIEGTITVKTGLHIGGNDAFSPIGAVDSPVIKDVLSQDPYIPGTTLKGKMRSLLGRMYNETSTKKREDDHSRITRLFGKGPGGIKEPKSNAVAGKLIFSDCSLINKEELKSLGAEMVTEVKYENSIDPLTAAANPRQIERVIPGSVFRMELIYNIYKGDDEKKVLEDMETLADGIKLINYDYLGGNGSRGYGAVEIHMDQVNAVIGQVDEELLKKCRETLGVL